MKNLLVLALIVFFAACSDDGSSVKEETAIPKNTDKVVVIVPQGDESLNHWKNTAAWFEENLAAACANLGIADSFKLDIEWIDENKGGMDDLGNELARRSDVIAIIGPTRAKNLDTIAGYVFRASKYGDRTALIAPMLTASEVVREYAEAKNKWFFSLTETDIALCETMLARAAASNAKSVALLVSESDNVKTFYDWFAFQAAELGLTVDGVYSYRDSSQLEKVADELFSGTHDFVICVPEKGDEVKTMLEAHEKNKSSSKLLFSSTAHDEAVLKLSESDGIEGFSTGSDPSSGFDISYFIKFNTYPVAGDAQFYDALMLTAFARLKMEVDSLKFLDVALRKVLQADSVAEEESAWEPFSMSRILKKIQNKESFNVSGASSNLSFDFDKGPVALHTVYTHWVVHDGEFVPMEYFATEGSKRVSASQFSYSWLFTRVIDEFTIDTASGEVNITEKVKYPEQSGNYALLVAASRSWLNYRHQADVFSMYQMLKKNGFDDDHIVLIAEDDLVENLRNPEPGTMINYKRNSIYENIKIDYKTSSLKPTDLFNILRGQKSEEFPQVIEGDSTTNIFVFWCGHGKSRRLNWLDADFFTYDNMLSLLTEMSEEKKFRKMFWVVETCFSGSVCEAFNELGAKGTLCMTAANANETSKTAVYDATWEAYLSNSFSLNFMDRISEVDADDPKSDLTLGTIYYNTVRNTLGSHVSVYNIDNYGDLYTSWIREFIVAK